MKTHGQRFVWDEVKALANDRKHGITFELGASALLDPLAVMSQNIDHEDSEDRWSLVGVTKSGILLVVIFTVDEEGGEKYVRIISARRPTSHERREYESGEYAIREPEMPEDYNVKPTQASPVDDDYDDGMKAEYDFSKGKRGLLKHLRFPIQIDNEALGYFHTRQVKLGIDMTEAINEILRVHVGLPAKPTEPRESGSFNDILRRHFGLPPRAAKAPPVTPDDDERRP
jgi:uncharacterized DUF497 family protein